MEHSLPVAEELQFERAAPVEFANEAACGAAEIRVFDRDAGVAFAACGHDELSHGARAHHAALSVAECEQVELLAGNPLLDEDRSAPFGKDPRGMGSGGLGGIRPVGLVEGTLDHDRSPDCDGSLDGLTGIAGSDGRRNAHTSGPRNSREILFAPGLERAGIGEHCLHTACGEWCREGDQGLELRIERREEDREREVAADLVDAGEEDFLVAGRVGNREGRFEKVAGIEPAFHGVVGESRDAEAGPPPAEACGDSEARLRAFSTAEAGDGDKLVIHGL